MTSNSLQSVHSRPVVSKAKTDSASALPFSVLERFKELYRTLDRDSLSLAKLAEFYAPDIHFQDSLHEINGLENLLAYFETMYENVPDISFVFHDELQDELSEKQQGQARAVITWTMTFRHKRLNKGKAITVEGSTLLKLEGDKVVLHRDYFDAGDMLYQHIPGLGLIIKQLKKRLV